MMVLAWTHGLRWGVCRPLSAAVLQEALPDLVWQPVLQMALMVLHPELILLPPPPPPAPPRPPLLLLELLELELELLELLLLHQQHQQVIPVVLLLPALLPAMGQQVPSQRQMGG